MRKSVLAIVTAFLFVALPAAAQTPTVVTAQIKDSNGVPYSFAKVAAQLVSSSGGFVPSPTIIVNGIPTQIGGQQNATADVNGNFSMNLFCNSAGGGCSVISPALTQWQFTANETGAPPPIGTGPQTCNVTLTISGASQSISSSFSACPALSNAGGGISTNGVGGSTNAAAPIMALYFSNVCPVANTGQCYFTPANTQIFSDGVWSSGGGGVVTFASSHNFCTPTCGTATIIGQRFAGYFMNGVPGGPGCVQGRSTFQNYTTGVVTVSSVQSNTQITVSASPGFNAPSNACVIIGTPDDSNASTFETAYAAITTFCVKAMLAAANYWFSSPHFNSQPLGCSVLPSIVGGGPYANMLYASGFELEGRGSGATTIYLGPDFPNGDTCAHVIGNTTGCFALPVESRWTDLQVSGGGQSTCQVAGGKNLIALAVSRLQNVSLTNMCWATATVIGIQADSGSQLQDVNNGSWGNTCLQTNNAGYGLVQAFKLACENSPGNGGATGSNVDVRASGGATPYDFQCIGCLLVGSIVTTTQEVVAVQSGAVARFNNTSINNCEDGTSCNSSVATILVKNNGGTVYLTDGQLGPSNGTAQPVAGIQNFTSGGKVYLERVSIGSNITNAYNDVAGAILYDLGGNSPLFTPGLSALNGTLIADGRSLMFSCTGTANASVTNSLYGTGPNVTATTCPGQTATLGTGIPFQQARTITGVKCTSSATTVSVACTVMVNGAAASTTCTMTAATSCVNFTTTAVNPADLLSARIVTGAAETGANIKMQVFWQ